MHAPLTTRIRQAGEPKKIIAIAGATGQQGGGLALAILREGDASKFSVRAITRNAQSEKAQWLNKLGAEVVQADINDEAQIKEAVKGCYGFFCVTFYWEHMNADEELCQARNMAIAAKEARVKHVIWSTLEDTRMLICEGQRFPSLDGKYKVPQYDSKGEANQYFSDLDVPTTYLLTSFYYDNFMQFGFAPKKTNDGGKLVLRLPMAESRHLAAIAAEDIGKCALGIFKRPEDYVNRRIGILGESLTCVEIAAKMANALQKDVRFEEISFDEFRQLEKLTGAKQLANMFRFYCDCETEVLTARDAAESLLLNPELMSFDQWLAKYKNYIPIGA